MHTIYIKSHIIHVCMKYLECSSDTSPSSRRH